MHLVSNYCPITYLYGVQHKLSSVPRLAEILFHIEVVYVMTLDNLLDVINEYGLIIRFSEAITYRC